MMKKFKGSLTNQDYLSLYKKNILLAKNFNLNQIQPSSVDLTLSEICFEISASFLSTRNSIKQNIKEIMIKKINLSEKYIFKKIKPILLN